MAEPTITVTVAFLRRVQQVIQQYVPDNLVINPDHEAGKVDEALGQLLAAVDSEPHQ